MRLMRWGPGEVPPPWGGAGRGATTLGAGRGATMRLMRLMTASHGRRRWRKRRHTSTKYGNGDAPRLAHLGPQHGTEDESGRGAPPVPAHICGAQRCGPAHLSPDVSGWGEGVLSAARHVAVLSLPRRERDLANDAQNHMHIIVKKRAVEGTHEEDRTCRQLAHRRRMRLIS